MKNFKLKGKAFSFSLVFLLCMGSGCKKLAETPKSFVTPESFYTTLEQIEAVFASSMNYLWSQWEGYGYGMYAFSNDDQLYGGSLNITANHGAELWSAHYAAINNLNGTIAALNKGNLQGDVSQLMGQAKFLRGYNYFMLVRMFGDVPLITEETPDVITGKIIRAPIAEVYSLIVNDFTEAAAKLPATWSSSRRGRPTSGAAKGLLAKTYLTMATAPMNEVSNYAKAAEMAKQVMSEGVYSLVPDINEVFSHNMKYGPEMMWSFNSNYEDRATDPRIWNTFEGWGDYSVDMEWEQKYPAQPRKDAYVQTMMDSVHYTEYGGGGYTPSIKKYLYGTTADFASGRSITNTPIIRYADVLLIFAEADNMASGGPTQATVDAINMVIDRANGYVENPLHPRMTTSMSKEAFDMAVIEERNWELCFEYDRWFDLVRKRILKEKSREEIQQNFSEADYLFPIPVNDIRLNPLLTQNPGY